jgi:redox-sensitive bicupin YhaK (pirin superfamily)
VGATRGPIGGVLVDPTFADVRVPAGGQFRMDLPPEHAAFAYVIDGAPSFGGAAVPEGAVAVFGSGPKVYASAERNARFLLCAAAPIKEPVARRGPFVMNTEDELRQAFDDYRTGRLVDG